MSESISELERLLCGSTPVGALEALAPRTDDAWSLTLPSLSTLPEGAAPWRKLRCCIATEDIAGPIRNGGIGTTYAALAELLVQLGHESTILYLRGAEVETGDLDHWVAHYAEKGVRFVPVPDYAGREGFRSHADRWLRSPYNMMRYLQDHPMDVVHVSEWRGCGYFSLSAKRQGIAFADTLFIVKTSSPWLWNRLYGSETIEKVDDLAKMHAERRSVELADLVVGGSLHLLRWMASQGYDLPRDRAFVQPNVVKFDHLETLLKRRAIERGVRMPFDEIVFFGRLEGRKGLFVFCQAIERLLRLGVSLPPTITFMGKEGRRLTARPDVSILDYIAEVSRNWPTRVKILTEYQQYEALDYLLAGPRLAVMPSVIENSSMAIYEAAICGVPCVASDVGGNMELVQAADWPHIFCKPHPLSLGDKLSEAIALGGYVPRPSFDNAANLDVWRRFHDALARGLREQLLAIADPMAGETDDPQDQDLDPNTDDWIDLAEDLSPETVAETVVLEEYSPSPDWVAQAAEPQAPEDHEVRRAGSKAANHRIRGNVLQRLGQGLTQIWRPTEDDDAEFIQSLKVGPVTTAPARNERQSPPPQFRPGRPSIPGTGAISICIYVAGAPGALKATLQSILGQSRAPLDIQLALDVDRREVHEEIRNQAWDLGLDCGVIEAFDLDAGAGLSLAAEAASGDLLLFLWEGATLEPDALSILKRVAARRAADVLTYMHRAPPTRGSKDAVSVLNGQLISSVSDTFFRQDIGPAPVLVRREAFKALGGFAEDHRLLGHEAELIARAQISGMVCDTVMRELGGAIGPSAHWLAQRGYDLPASRFRIIRPLLAAAPLAVRELMLMTKGLQARPPSATAAAKSKAPRLDPIIEEPFARLMQAILTEQDVSGSEVPRR